MTQLPEPRDWMLARSSHTRSPLMELGSNGRGTTVGVVVPLPVEELLDVCDAPVDHDAVALWEGVGVAAALLLEEAVIEGVAGVAGISQQYCRASEHALS